MVSFFSTYNVETGEGQAHGGVANASVYTTTKLVNASIRAKEFFLDNERIHAAADRIIFSQKNYADYMRRYSQVPQRIWDHGAQDENRLHLEIPYQESYLLTELAAAMEPIGYFAHKDWRKHRENNLYVTDFLETEPVIRVGLATFVEHYAHILYQSHRTSEGWQEQFNNFFAHFSAWSDDNNPRYLTVFSAGADLDAQYNADKLGDHPYNIIHFPAVLGFGMYGNSVPMVAGYRAYREGIRTQMSGRPDITAPDGSNAAQVLTRYSSLHPDWIVRRIAVPDFVFGMFGLIEHLEDGKGNRGIIDRVIARDSKPEDFGLDPDMWDHYQLPGEAIESNQPWEVRGDDGGVEARIGDDSLEMDIVRYASRGRMIEVFRDYPLDPSDPKGTRYIIGRRSYE